MATKSLALIAIEEHHVPEGTGLCNGVAAAARIMLENQVVCNFD